MYDKHSQLLVSSLIKASAASRASKELSLFRCCKTNGRTLVLAVGGLLGIRMFLKALDDLGDDDVRHRLLLEIHVVLQEEEEDRLSMVVGCFIICVL